MCTHTHTPQEEGKQEKKEEPKQKKIKWALAERTNFDRRLMSAPLPSPVTVAYTYIIYLFTFLEGSVARQPSLSLSLPPFLPPSLTPLSLSLSLE